MTIWLLGGVAVGYIGSHAVRWLRDRLDDVADGYRDHWWSKYHFNQLTVQQLAELYQRTNTAVRTAMLEMPADRWFRPYPREG